MGQHAHFLCAHDRVQPPLWIKINLLNVHVLNPYGSRAKKKYLNDAFTYSFFVCNSHTYLPTLPISLDYPDFWLPIPAGFHPVGGTGGKLPPQTP